LLAMEVNDDAGSLTPRGALRFFVGTPPGACSLLQGPPRRAILGPARLNRHPCRFAHCAEPERSLSMGQENQKPKQSKSKSEAA
jgi:hypothetical protein